MPKNGIHPTDSHVGKRVRMRRMMLGMSQEMLGDALGVTFQQVQKYENGTNRISASRLQHISQILQVPAAFFFEGVPRRAAGAMHKPTLRFRNTYQIISPRPTGSISPKLSCKFQTPNFDVPLSILSNRWPAPTISELLGPPLATKAN
jgi:transcriptional regulator with XRE-family HTH domain